MGGNQSSVPKVEVSCCPPGSHGAPPAFEDEPKGEFITVGPTETPCYYVAPPEGTTSTLAMILYPDVWSLKSRILKMADWMAQEAKVHVLICDCFRGKTKDDHGFPGPQAWFQSMPYDPVVAQDTASCVEFLEKEKGVTGFGALGFCWGMWAIAKTCQAQQVDWKVAISPHPSFRIEEFAFGGDSVALMKSVTCPMLLMPAGNDPDYTKPDSPEFKSMTENGSKSILFEEMAHGWTTRGDMSDPTMERDVEKAMHETLHFLKLHLK